MTGGREQAADSETPAADVQRSVEAKADRAAENGSAAAGSEQSRSSLRKQRFWLTMGLLAAVILVLVFGLPGLVRFFQTISTDDAYVNAHVTYVSARVPDVVENVLVDENDFVEPGTPLLKLDRRPYQVVVDQKQAALAQTRLKIDQQVASWKAARAALAKAKNDVVVDLANLRYGAFQVESTQDEVRAAIAALRSNVATRELQQANEVLARKEYERSAKLATTGAATAEEVEQRRDALQVAHESVLVAEESIQKTRAELGLQPDVKQPLSLPADLVQTYSSVRSAVASAQQTLARLGVEFSLQRMKPSEVEALAEKLAASFRIEQVPAVEVAQAQADAALAALGGAAFNASRPYEHPSVVQAEQELAQAELDLSYTEVSASVRGFVSKRSVNPGDHVQPGQSLLAL